MAKFFFKNFENLRGIDARASDLTREMFYAKNLTNCRFTTSKAIRKRNGFELLGQAGGFVGMHNYVSYSATTGETVEELLRLTTISGGLLALVLSLLAQGLLLGLLRWWLRVVIGSLS